jgi:hypothetical protein
MDSHQFESLRESYKPSKVKVLYIGESRPAGNTFFYQQDSILYSAISQAWFFRFGHRISEGEAFLDIFKEKGCYLDDLCKIPVNKMDEEQGTLNRLSAIPNLAERIRNYQPEAICIVINKIAKDIKAAINEAGVKNIPVYITSFPWKSNDRMMKSISEHELVLKDLYRLGIMND